MNVLFIGGTGIISTAITKLAHKKKISLTLLNRGNRSKYVPSGVTTLTCDINNESEVKALIQDKFYDVVVNFIAFHPSEVERDIRLFSGKTNQYIFISSASAYQKPLLHYKITESTPLHNPYWDYSQNKILCEHTLMNAYNQSGFPVTIIRPSHTYGDFYVPLALSGEKGSYSVIQRMLDGKPVIVHGDGLSLWTFTHSTDFAKAFVGIMGNPHALGEAIHITSDETVTWNDAYQAIGKVLGVTPNIVYIPSTTIEKLYPAAKGHLLGDKAHSVVFDNSKIKRLVPGFTAKVRFDQGIRETLNFLLSHPEFQIPDPEFDTWTDDVVSKFS